MAQEHIDLTLLRERTSNEHTAEGNSRRVFRAIIYS